MDKQKDYIEREALGTILNEVIYNSCGGAKVAGIRYARDMLATIPPADVKPVVRGEWITDGDVHKCSACGLTTCDDEYGDDPTEEYHFCPNCGADMRREGK